MKAKDTTEPILFLPGYGENPKMCRPFTDALSDLTHRPVITGDYYDSSQRSKNDWRWHAPSQALATRAMLQYRRYSVAPVTRLVTHSYGSIIGNSMASELTDDARAVLLAPSGFGQLDTMLAPRFVVGMGRELISYPESLGFALRGMANILRRPIESTAEAIELSRSNSTGALRKLGDRALVVTYARDPVFSDEKTALHLLQDMSNEVAVVSPIGLPEANHSSPFEEPEATALLIAQHFE